VTAPIEPLTGSLLQKLEIEDPKAQKEVCTADNKTTVATAAARPIVIW
jgi:hypothetical protein